MTKNNWTDGDSVTATQLNRMEDQLVITCTSGTRPTGVEGQRIWETNTDRERVYDGSAWRLVYSPWTAYTPSWTNLTVGNGTQSANYCYVPGGMRMTGIITFGSTSAVTGSVTQTIPNSISAVAEAVGGFHLDDANGIDYSGSVRVLNTNTAVVFYGDSGNWTATTPFAYASGDKFVWDITIPF